MQCPECNGNAVDGKPLRTGGVTVFPHCCEKCGYTWSTKNQNAVHGRVFVPAGSENPGQPQRKQRKRKQRKRKQRRK